MPVAWLVLVCPGFRDGPQFGLVAEVPHFVADGSSCSVPASGRASVGRPGGFELFEGALHVGAADLDAFGDVFGLAGAVLCEPFDNSVAERWEAVVGGVEAHAAGGGVPGDSVAEGGAGFGFAVFAFE